MVVLASEANRSFGILQEDGRRAVVREDREAVAGVPGLQHMIQAKILENLNAGRVQTLARQAQRRARIAFQQQDARSTPGECQRGDAAYRSGADHRHVGIERQRPAVADFLLSLV